MDHAGHAARGHPVTATVETMSAEDVPRCDSHRSCARRARLTRASIRFDSLARSIRSNLPQCFKAGARRRFDFYLQQCSIELVSAIMRVRDATMCVGPGTTIKHALHHCPVTSSRLFAHIASFSFASSTVYGTMQHSICGEY